MITPQDEAVLSAETSYFSPVINRRHIMTVRTRLPTILGLRVSKLKTKRVRDGSETSLEKVKCAMSHFVPGHPMMEDLRDSSQFLLANLFDIKIKFTLASYAPRTSFGTQS